MMGFDGGCTLQSTTPDGGELSLYEPSFKKWYKSPKPIDGDGTSTSLIRQILQIAICMGRVGSGRVSELTTDHDLVGGEV